jgi:predicted O-methyltransferase YrrM
MRRYTKHFIIPLATRYRWQHVCEIGAQFGGGTELLLSVPGLRITVVDPCLDADLEQKFSMHPRIIMRKGLSLDILPILTETYDAFLIDGDHNWYTVFHELQTIDERQLLRPGGFIFLHDVSWPWARRDLYYQPATIPSQYRHAYDRRALQHAGCAGEDFSTYYKAEHEGGTRNGVLTAIEDFLAAHREYRFFRIRSGVGLGLMQLRGREARAFGELIVKGCLVNLAVYLRDQIASVSSKMRHFAFR